MDQSFKKPEAAHEPSGSAATSVAATPGAPPSPAALPSEETGKGPQDQGATGSIPLFTRRFTAWSRRFGLARKSAIGLSIAAILCGLATFSALSGNVPLQPDPILIRVLLLCDLVVLLLLGAMIGRRIMRIWFERRRGSAGSRLHSRLALLFSIVAVAPAILVAIFASLFLSHGVQVWFSDKVNTAVRESVAVAEAYIGEHIQTIRADVLAMANDLNRGAAQLSSNQGRFNQVIGTQAALRNLSEAVVIDRSQRVLARSSLSFVMEFERVPPRALEKAAGGDVVILTTEEDDRVRALVRLDRFFDAYLYVGRFIEPRVINHVERTRQAVAEYEKLQKESTGIEITFVLIFIVVSMLMLLAAIWFGLTIATKMVEPIGGLVSATERVREGDLSARVAEGSERDEMDILSRAFNRMTSQLEHQRSELVQANNQLDERRRFTEAVLAGVTAGVIGLDRTGRIDLPNRSALQLLGRRRDQLVGRTLREAIPEMSALLDEAEGRPDRIAQAQIDIVIEGRPRNFLTRVATERDEDGVGGFIVTFDDITELVSAQRMAAWGDVARRIAHEIKNPLTPIQLSAERLKRKYVKEIESDPEVFSQCTDTIIRHVGDIGNMVDEFSAFARMPAPVFHEEDLGELVRQAVFLQQVAHPGIAYSSSLPDETVTLLCDGRQVSRVLTNLLQNAAEAITGDGARTGEGGRISISLVKGEGKVVVEVADNGPGLPMEGRNRLTEPYVTKRERGTGLGLAIVKKIMEEHGGELHLGDAPGGGAMIRAVFPLGGDDKKQKTGPLKQKTKMVSHGA